MAINKIELACIALSKPLRPAQGIVPNHVYLNVLRAASAMGRPHVAEIYSPPRVTSLADQFGLIPGFALDLTVIDPTDGQPWDFDDEEKRLRALQKVKTDKPQLLIGSPMCKAYSILQGLNKERMGEVKYNAMLDKARIHLECCVMLYRLQLDQGRYFLHEHPASAGSWKEPRMVDLMNMHGVERVVADMCCFGMTSHDEQGTGLVKKPTGFLTNAECIAR